MNTTKNVSTLRMRYPGSRPTPKHLDPAVDDFFVFHQKRRKPSRSGTVALDAFLDDGPEENLAKRVTASAQLLKLLGMYIGYRFFFLTNFQISRSNRFNCRDTEQINS